jgi:hypothetical protein
MKQRGVNKEMKLTTKLMVLTGGTMLMCMAIAVPVLAQDRGESPIMNKEKDFDTMTRELRRISEKKDSNKTPAPTPADLLSQARGDFMTLQMVNKNLKLAASRTDALDLKFVWNSVSEIRVRAEDLNTILPLPKRDKAAEKLKPLASASPDELKVSVLDLSKRIRDFIMNPCFREPALADNEQSRKAKLDLENIIELSKQLQKDSEKLEKPAEPSSVRPIP